MWLEILTGFQNLVQDHVKSVFTSIDGTGIVLSKLKGDEDVIFSSEIIAVKLKLEVSK